MAARPVVSIQNADKEGSSGSAALPAVFSAPIRPDVVHFVHSNMAKNSRQAYAVSKMAGHQHSAESWGTGRAVARIPRVSGGGTHRAGQAAFGNMCRKGRMFAPTRIWRKWHRKINVNQKRYAVASAIAASAVPALVMARGHSIESVNEIPCVVANGAENITKTSKAVKLLAQLHADDDVERVRASKKIRAGKGKMRNRRFVQRRGPLVIYENDNGINKSFRNIPGVEVCNVDRLNLLQLAPGGHLGRFVIWTEGAFNRLDKLYGTSTTKAELKNNYSLPNHIMANADLNRIINSDEIQSVVRDARDPPARRPRKKNALTNFGARVKLNPYAKTTARRAMLAKDASDKRRAAGVQAKRFKRTDKKAQLNRMFSEE